MPPGGGLSIFLYGSHLLGTLTLLGVVSISFYIVRGGPYFTVLQLMADLKLKKKQTICARRHVKFLIFLYPRAGSPVWGEFPN